MNRHKERLPSLNQIIGSFMVIGSPKLYRKNSKNFGSNESVS